MHAQWHVMEDEKLNEYISVAGYYKELGKALDTYEFLAFNQKIYNFYLDTFGPSFAYLLYHFPGHSLQLNDSRFNYREKVQFLRNFIRTNESFCLSNLSLVNRLNSLDLSIYMTQAELMSRYIGREYRFHLDPVFNLRLRDTYTLGHSITY